MEKYLSCDDVAEKYGVKKMTVWTWIREKKLNAITAGIATKSPTAVATKASEIPLMTEVPVLCDEPSAPNA